MFGGLGRQTAPYSIGFLETVICGPLLPPSRWCPPGNTDRAIPTAAPKFATIPPTGLPHH